MAFDALTFEFGLPFGVGKVAGRWTPDQAERDASWEMYVELVTRIAVEDLGDDEGLLREALLSLYSLFASTRDILQRYGPGVARVSGSGDQSFGSLSVAILNRVLRPLLAAWHPALLDYEAHRPDNVSATAWEDRWSEAPRLRLDLAQVREALTCYADLLAEAAGVASLHSTAGPPVA